MTYLFSLIIEVFWRVAFIEEILNVFKEHIPCRIGLCRAPDPGIVGTHLCLGMLLSKKCLVLSFF